MAVITMASFSMLAEVPRPEHPRPDFYRENWMTLNGEWQFAVDRKADRAPHPRIAVGRHEGVGPERVATGDQNGLIIPAIPDQIREPIDVLVGHDGAVADGDRVGAEASSDGAAR